MAKRLAEFQKYKFINPDPTLRNNLLGFGFEIGDGWIPIMRELCEKIQAIIDTNPERYEGFEFLQVKEKWGSLRVYFNYDPPEFDDILEEAERKSTITCEVCGNPGKLREDKSWIVTLCDDCNNKEQK